MDKLIQAFNFRHACKIFDETKKISQDDINYILEAGRKSPSSFGLEPWHFVIISDEKSKIKLQPICYNQQQIVSCSHLVIVLYRNAVQFTAQSEYLRSAIQRQLPADSDATTVDVVSQYFINFCNNDLPKEVTVNCWAEMQCYIPSANMLTAAAYRGIDSCAIGGFQHDKLSAQLEEWCPPLNKNNFGIALCLAFGYRKNPQQPQIRWSIDEVSTFL